MIKDIKKLQFQEKLKSVKNQKFKHINKLKKGNTFGHLTSKEAKSPLKIQNNLGKRNNKNNSCSSSNQNKTEMSTMRIKDKLDKQKNIEYNIDNKRLNNYLQKSKNFSKQKNSITKNFIIIHFSLMIYLINIKEI